MTYPQKMAHDVHTGLWTTANCLFIGQNTPSYPQ
jgi:hypothetical protein